MEIDGEAVLLVEPPRCEVCGAAYQAASRGRMACEGGHVFTLAEDMSGLVRIDHLPPDEAEAAVEVAVGAAARAAGSLS